jgi:hypothetical protein
MRAYRFLFIIQPGHGDNGLEKTTHFEFLFGDPKVSLKYDDVKAKVYALAMRDNHQNILSLAVFSKFSAFCKGEFGSEKQYKDSTEVVHLQDFVMANSSIATINALPLLRDMENKFIIVAIQNLKLILLLTSSTNWSQYFRQFMDWACSTGESSEFKGPASYKGKVRFYFARMVFSSIMSCFSSLDFSITVESIGEKISAEVAKIFLLYENDIRSLYDLMMHSDTYNAAQEVRSIDAGLLLKAQKGVGKLSLDTPGDESPSKKHKKDLKKPGIKIDTGNAGGGKGVTTASTTASGKMRFCIKHMGSIVLPNEKKFVCGNKPCSFKHCSSLEEYVTYYGSREALKEANSLNVSVGNMGKVRAELTKIL